jgi:hypothetical protein
MPEHAAAGWKTPIWDTYKKLVNEGEGRTVPFDEVERYVLPFIAWRPGGEDHFVRACASKEGTAKAEVGIACESSTTPSPSRHPNFLFCPPTIHPSTPYFF